MKFIRSWQIKNTLKAKRIDQTDIDKYQDIDQLCYLTVSGYSLTCILVTRTAAFQHALTTLKSARPHQPRMTWKFQR
jgi:hypothetical protein